MASPPSNGREGDGKEHRSYNDPIEEISSGRVPVAAIGAGLRSERLDLGEHMSDDQVVPPAGSRIAQPISSNYIESESPEENIRRIPLDPYLLQLYPANKTKVNQDSKSTVNSATVRPSLSYDSLNNTGDTTENQSNVSIGPSQQSNVSSDPTTGNHNQLLMQKQQRQPTTDTVSSTVGQSESIQLSNVTVSSDPTTGNHDRLLMQQQQQQHPTTGNFSESVNNDVGEEMKSDRPAQDASRIPTMCLRCDQERINTMLQPCHDLCVCCNCGKYLKEQNGACPYCSIPVEDYIHPVNLPFPK